MEEKMFKKVVMWTIYAGLVGALIFGAVNHTSAKTNSDNFAKRIGISGQNSSPGSQGSGQDGNESGQSGNGSRQSGNGNRQADRDGADLQETNQEDHDWAEMFGDVSDFDASSLWVQTNSSGILEITGRAWRFAQVSGYQPAVGNQLELTGFYENGEFEVSLIRDITSGQTIALRDESGRPLWSGGGGH